MKKTFRFFAISAITLLALSFVSCGVNTSNESKVDSTTVDTTVIVDSIVTK